MYKSRIKGLVVLAGCFFLSACTETIIREVTPSTTTTGSESSVTTTGGTVGAGSNMVPVDTTTTGSSTVSGTTTTTTSSPPTTISNTLLQDPTNETTIGSPGVTVDCNDTLPCRWVSTDTQFSLTVTSADNTATRARLSVSYFITTTHDSTLTVSSVEEAIDNLGSAYRIEDQLLGSGNGGTPQGILAGDQLTGAVNFDRSASGNLLSDWSIAIVDGGVIRIPTFTGIPVGPITESRADCQYTLPCVWTTPDSDVAITLSSVGGLSTNGRVSVNFTVETAVALPFAVDQGSNAVGSDGTAFEGRTFSLGLETDFEKLTTTASARIPYFGSVNFYRTDTTPSHLLLLTLALYQDDPVPRWNPQYINVPIQ